MKKLLLATASAALVAGYATSLMAAATDKTQITINATAEDVCIIGGALASDPTASANTNITTTTLDNDASVLTITDFIDDTTAILKDAAVTLTYADSYCNYGHNISMESTNGGMDHDASEIITGGTFTQHIVYTATATMGAQSNTLDLTGTSTTARSSTTATSTATAVAGANRADLVVAIDIAAADHTDPVLSGAYTDTLCIQLGVAL